ncbi:hypothetical protein Barb6_03025 [Bacteroidales bacterium Barb6]|nr:hypothetical protein Barb6_03025 [Bacteroidales bacterium Barb6]
MKAFATAGFIFAARFTVPDDVTRKSQRDWGFQPDVKRSGTSGSGKYIPAFRRNARFQPHMQRSGMWGQGKYLSIKF